MAKSNLTWSGSPLGRMGIRRVAVVVIAVLVLSVALVFIPGEWGERLGALFGLLLVVLAIALTLAIPVFAVISIRQLVGRGPGSYKGVIAGLDAWATRHGWEFTSDRDLAMHWATRYHFSDRRLETPHVAARGWVYGHDAMIMFTFLGVGKNPQPTTIVAVDADADYPLTAVLPASSTMLFHPFGDEVPLESVEFGRAWRAMGREAAGSHAIFTPRVIERLLAPVPGSPPQIVWDGPGIRAMDEALISEPTHLESRLKLLGDLAGLTPGYQVTHTSDDPSLVPYVAPPPYRPPVAALVLIGLGVLVGVLVPVVADAGGSTAVMVVGEIMCLGLVTPGILLASRNQVRRAQERQAIETARHGLPPGATAPPKAAGAR